MPSPSAFKPKAVLAEAKTAEKAGDAKTAASHYLALSVYLRKKKRAQEALLLAQKASKLQPDSTRLLLQVAVCQEILGQTDEADATLRTFVRSAMEKKRLAGYRSYVDALVKEHPRLRQTYHELVLELDRTRPEPFVDKAAALRRDGDLAGARKALFDAIRTRGADAAAVAMLKECFGDVGKEKEARRILEKFEKGKLAREDLLPLLDKLTAVEVDVDSFTEFRTQEKNLNRLIQDLERELGIELDEGRDRVEPLVQEFRRRSDPILGSDPKARIDMALAFFEMGLFRHAREEIQGVAESDALFPQGQMVLGEIALAEGSDLAALDAFQRALRTAPPDDHDLRNEANYRLVQIYHRLGDHSQALLTAERLEQADPQYRDLRYWKMQILEALSKSQ